MYLSTDCGGDSSVYAQGDKLLRGDKPLEETLVGLQFEQLLCHFYLWVKHHFVYLTHVKHHFVYLTHTTLPAHGTNGKVVNSC